MRTILSEKTSSLSTSASGQGTLARTVSDIIAVALARICIADERRSPVQEQCASEAD
jgi:hypothetical protein